jgi:hypothetical protein
MPLGYKVAPCKVIMRVTDNLGFDVIANGQSLYPGPNAQTNDYWGDYNQVLRSKGESLQFATGDNYSGLGQTVYMSFHAPSKSPDKCWIKCETNGASASSFISIQPNFADWGNYARPIAPGRYIGNLYKIYFLVDITYTNNGGDSLPMFTVELSPYNP